MQAEVTELAGPNGRWERERNAVPTDLMPER
jgi:hypothetical protein